MSSKYSKKKILIEVPKDIFQLIKDIKVRVGDPTWNELVIRAIQEYSEVRGAMMYCPGSIKFTDDNKMEVDLVKCLTNILNAKIYWLGEKNPPRWKLLQVQSVFYAFAWYLAHANELRYFWDHTGAYLYENFMQVLLDIGLSWEQAKSHATILLSTIYSMYPWLWSGDYTSNIGKKVLSELERMYPEIKARWAGYEEDTRGNSIIYPVASKPLCIQGISVVTSWEDEAGTHIRCYSFID